MSISKNHRMAWVEKVLKDHLVSTPLLCAGSPTTRSRAAQSHIQPGLECLQGWGIHNLLGQPVPPKRSLLQGMQSFGLAIASTAG